MATTSPAQPSRRRGRLLTSGQVALVFGVDPRTVRTWDRRFTVTRTLGGHRRYRESEVR
ncbi:MAG TPA: MerR family DNA-binding transcriptional regulator, partial [Streptosporangiaceae bacterium]